MREQAKKSETLAPAPSPVDWHVPVAVDDIAEAARHFDLVPDASLRAAIAKVANLRELPRLEAHFDVSRRGAGLHVAGVVSATVGQNCVVTLEPLSNEVEEAVDLRFEPRQLPARQYGANEAGDKEPRDVKWNDPEPLIDGVIDLGALAVEFLIVGLDPYPRKAGAVFEPPAERAAEEGPFAALAKLTKG